MTFRGVILAILCLNFVQPRCRNSDTLTPELNGNENLYGRFEGVGQTNNCINDRHCVVSGCSSEICASEDGFSTCEHLFWKPQGCCGCYNGECQWLIEDSGCPLEKDWTVVSNNITVCTATRWICDEGMEQWIDQECGCGCKPDECEIPDDWTIMGGNTSECALIDFICDAGSGHWNSRCGCGCKPAECEIPDDWTVMGETPSICALVDFICYEGFEYWGGPCGCGCKPSENIDLIVNDVTRDWPYYKIEYCNAGSGAAGPDFTLLLTNTATGNGFQTNYLYPFTIPAPGDCAWTGGITCGLIGDPNCDDNICVEAFVDDQLQVAEASENNNELTKCFGPDLVVNDVSREWPYYKIEFCNVGSTAIGPDFTLLLTNVVTGNDFQTNYFYPFSIPAPGDCVWTGGITCGLIGDENCDLDICVEAFVDDQNQVMETDESNNKKEVCSF